MYIGNSRCAADSNYLELLRKGIKSKLSKGQQQQQQLPTPATPVGLTTLAQIIKIENLLIADSSQLFACSVQASLFTCMCMRSIAITINTRTGVV
jgi:hypothetical protein